MANISKAPVQPHTHLITLRRLVVLLLGLFILTANSMADVVFSDNTFTGDGTYSAAVQSDATLTATPDTGKTITLSGVISGACSITQNGAGTLVISGANTYTGETKVLNGTLNLTKTGSGNGKASLNIGNTVTVEGGSSVLKGHGTIFGYGAGSIGRINLNNGGTLENDLSTAHVTISAPVYMNNGVITSTGNGDGYGNFIIDCGIHVTGGTDNELKAVKFQIRNDQGSGNPNKEQGGTFDIASGAKLSVNSNISNYNSESMTPPVIKKGAGELVLSGASTYTKGTQIEAGTLTVANNAALGNTSGAVTFTGNSTLKAGADNLALANPMTINSGKTGTVDTNGKTMSLGGVISGAGALTKTGTGALTLSGANTYTGITTVSGGTLNITGSAFASRLVITGGATATIDAGETGVANMNADGYNSSLMIGNGSTGSLTLNSGNVTVHNSGSGSNGSIQLGTNGSGNGVLTINGGTMQVDGRILMGANAGAIEGTLNMNDGTLTLGVPGSYTTGGDPSCGVLWFGANKSTVNLNGGTLAMFGMKHNNPNASSSFNFNGGTLKAVADNNTDFLTAASGMKFYIKQGGAIFDTNGYNVKVSAKLEQGTDAGDAAGKVTKNGAGTLTLSGASTFTGDIDINAGTVVIAYNAKGGGTTDTATALGNPSVAGRKITVKSGAELVTSNGGAGTDVFGGAEAHPKFTLVADGGTIATATDQLTSYGDIELKNGGVFEDRGGHSTWFTIFNGDVSVTSGNATIQSTSAGRGISLRGYRNGVNAGVTFDVAKNSTLTVSALLKDCTNSKVASKFTKTGEGTMVLSNRNNTYTGNIVVDGGILKASGTWNGVNKPTVLGQYGSKTVTVNSGAEFIFAAQDVVSNASTSSPVQFIINGGKISNEGAVYNNLNNTVFKNGGELYASNGHGSWKAYKLSTKVSVLRDAPSAQPAKITASTNGNATISFGHTTSLYVEDVTSASATELDTKSDLIISAKVTNPNTESNKTFYKDGVGTLEFTAANTFNGTVGIREGVLRLSGAGTLGTSAVTLTTDGTKHGTLEFVDSTASIPNAISGEGDILVSSGTANITGSVTQTGGSTMLADGTTLSIINNATLNNLAVVDENSLAMVNVTGNLTLNNDKQTKFIGPISAGTIEKTGDGTLQLYAAADGEGIHAERFIVSSGRLDMKDYFVGKLEVNSGATLSPGNSVGTLTVDGEGAVVINSGAILLIEQDETGIDQIIAKSFEIADDAVLQLALTSVQPGQTYEIFIQKDEDGNVKDFEGKYAGEGFWTSLLSPESAYYWNLTLDGNVVMATMDANAVPEPSTWALLVLGAAGLLYWRKRNSK